MLAPTFMRLVNVSAASSSIRLHRFSCEFSTPIVVDFEQPRALYTKVLNDTGRQHLVQNISAHLGNVKSAEIKARQRKCFSLSNSHFSGRRLTPLLVAVFAAVDQGLSDAIARAVGAQTAAPLAVAPATEVVPLKTNIGQKAVAIA
jgi:catalase